MIDVERADYMYRPGRYGTIEFGPFAFSVNTADGGSIGFEVKAGRWSWTWALYHVPAFFDEGTARDE